MSVDTRNKRAACLMLCLPFGRVHPLPDGSLNTAADREHMALSYPLGAVVGTPFNPVWASHANQVIGPVVTP